MNEPPTAIEIETDLLNEYRRPALSLTAVAGFVLSFLFILAPLGIVLGIVGIIRTRGGRRRGMGFAIASIPIGLVTGSLAGVFIAFVYGVFLMSQAAMGSAVFLESSKSSMSASAAEAYGRLSDRFKVIVDESEFVNWAEQVAQKHGTLQSIKRSDKSSAVKFLDDGSMLMNMTGQFVNGPAAISVRVGMKGMEPEIDDIAVDGVSPREAK